METYYTDKIEIVKTGDNTAKGLAVGGTAAAALAVTPLAPFALLPLIVGGAMGSTSENYKPVVIKEAHQRPRNQFDHYLEQEKRQLRKETLDNFRRQREQAKESKNI